MVAQPVGTETARRIGAHCQEDRVGGARGAKGYEASLEKSGFQKDRYDLNHKTNMIMDLSPSEEDLLARMKGKTYCNIRWRPERASG